MKTSDMNVSYRYHSGSDLEVVNAARVSFDKESSWEGVEWKEDVDPDSRSLSLTPVNKLSDKDTKLINYLAKHNHWTPFAHNSITLRIKAPIFVARQMGKHQVGLVWNEVSRRYVDSEPEFYFPKEWRGRANNVKQGSSGLVNIKSLQPPQEVITFLCNYYHALLDAGVCPEQARMVLPQNMMTEWIWTGSLAAFWRVFSLRLDPHTQAESRELAEGIKAVVEPLFPVSWAALEKASGTSS